MGEHDDDQHAHDHGHDHHHDHGHDHHEHGHGDEHGHGHDEEPVPDVSGWAASTAKATCPACGAAGALTLGGGLFCPSCGEISMNPGYQAAPAAEPDPD